VEQVRAQLRGGRVGPALETVHGMCAFLGPLEDNEVAREAVSHLVCMAWRGEEITLRALDRVARAIEEGRARRRRRARGRT
jgi:hypothetical protein